MLFGVTLGALGDFAKLLFKYTRKRKATAILSGRFCMALQ